MGKGFDLRRSEKLVLFKKFCNETGMKMTPQRFEIFFQVSTVDYHPSAEDVFNKVREKLPTISLDTVYRTLNTLEHYGLISKIRFDANRKYFDPNTTPHQHVVCLQCNRVKDLDWHDLDYVPKPEGLRGWRNISLKKVQLQGLCPRCSRGGSTFREARDRAVGIPQLP